MQPPGTVSRERTPPSRRRALPSALGVLLAILFTALAACAANPPGTGLTRAPRPLVSAPAPLRADDATRRTINTSAILATIASPSAPTSGSSRVITRVIPLGSIPIDGQILPISSPDGRWIVTQTPPRPGDQAAAWSDVLADADADATRPSPAPTRLQWFRLDDGSAVTPARAPAFVRVHPLQPLPAGLVLGRSADNDGFLVESPRTDGSRWIGLVRWSTGELRWLIRDQRVSAHATLCPPAAPGVRSLAFVRRATDLAAPAPFTELVLADLALDGSVRERSIPAHRFGAFALAYPLITSDDPEHAAVALLAASSRASTDQPTLLALLLGPLRDLRGDRATVPAPAAFDLRVAPSPDAMQQAVASLQTPALPPRGHNPRAFLLYAPTSNSMVLLDRPASDPARLIARPLAPGSVAAVLYETDADQTASQHDSNTSAAPSTQPQVRVLCACPPPEGLALWSSRNLHHQDSVRILPPEGMTTDTPDSGVLTSISPDAAGVRRAQAESYQYLSWIPPKHGIWQVEIIAVSLQID